MASKQKIALCLEYPLAMRGGVSVLIESLIEGFAGRFDLVLVSPDTQAALAESPVAGMIQKHLHWDPANPSADQARALTRQLVAERIGLAHFHLGGNFGFGNRFPNKSPIIFTSNAGIRVVSSVHLVVSLLDGYCGPRKPLWFKLAMLPLAYAGKTQQLLHVRREIAVSQHDCGKLMKWYAPLRGRYTQIYHSRLREGSQPPAGGAREPMILNVGHVAVRKGQVVLAEAFARIASRHPEWRLCIAGHIAEESAAESIRAIAKNHGLENRIQLLGTRNDAMDWMSRAMIYVQPSIFEALGLALQEAMFRGCPSIGARAGGIPELVTHEKTGLLVDAGDAAQLAQAMEKLIQSPELRDRFGRLGAASIIERGMTMEKMAANHIRLYESILQQR